MRALLPHPDDAPDLASIYASPDRRRPDGRPWVLADMVASADGAATVEGVSGSLGGEGDRQVFHAVQAVADVVLVGAGTVRAERYRPARSEPEALEQRRARGQSDAPRIAVVTASGNLDVDLPLFADPSAPPLVLTGSGADPDRLAALEGVAEVVRVSDTDDVPARAAVDALGHAGHHIVLCEGGPSLLGQVIAADLLDELCLTVAATLVVGTAQRIAHGDAATATDMALAHVLEHDGALFLRYVRPGA